jgi:hypothetical protein
MVSAHYNGMKRALKWISSDSCGFLEAVLPDGRGIVCRLDAVG